ncbi:MAG: prepilin-type N-terminal cleavage/methylation domain-containing protein [Lachnospiraceae bacterium]|nr:prepilin-type N-terminal cleavage/methylation domain-containing protein [Lachnospiraceae bacterium]
MCGRNKTGNEGFSLVELLLAVTILAIIVVPLLHAFLTSAKINAKSKEELRQTSVAQDIMEGLKAYSVEELAYEFNFPLGGIKEYNGKFQVVDPAIISGGVGGGNVLELNDNGSGIFVDIAADKSVTGVGDPNADHNFTNRADGKYYFAIKNMNLADTSDPANAYMQNADVDVLIVADASAYKDAGVSHNSYNHNSTQLIDIPLMNTYTDAFYVEDSDTTTNLAAAQWFKNKYYAANTSVSVNSILPNVQKTIKIKSEMTAGAAHGGNDRYTVNVSTEYTLHDPGIVSPEIYSTSSLAFDNISTGEKLDNVYLFYQPVYHSSSAYGTLKDRIIYEPGAGTQTDWYIVKQGSTSVYADEEENYVCSVEINGNQDTVGMIKHNLDYNSVTNTPVALSKTEWSLAGSVPRYELFGETTKDRIYKCTVYLFKKGTIDGWLGSTPYDFSKALEKLEGNMR